MLKKSTAKSGRSGGEISFDNTHVFVRASPRNKNSESDQPIKLENCEGEGLYFETKSRYDTKTQSDEDYTEEVICELIDNDIDCEQIESFYSEYTVLNSDYTIPSKYPTDI